MKSFALRVILAVTISMGCSDAVFGQSIFLGVLEDNHGWYAGEPNFRAVRVAFKKVGLEWKPFPSDCMNQACLKQIVVRFPPQVSWTIGINGRTLGTVVGRTPSQYSWYAAVGQQEIMSKGPIPTIGKRSPSDFVDAAVYRPLVANSHPYFKDPERWKPISPSADLISKLRSQFRARFPKLCRSSEDETKLETFAYTDQDVQVTKAYGSRGGWTLAELHLEAVECGDVEAGFDIADPWFVIDPKGSATYLDAGLWLVDAGDYDNDGHSELLFWINREDEGGYELFYDSFQKRSVFHFSYH